MRRLPSPAEERAAGLGPRLREAKRLGHAPHRLPPTRSGPRLSRGEVRPRVQLSSSWRIRLTRSSAASHRPGAPRSPQRLHWGRSVSTPLRAPHGGRPPRPSPSTGRQGRRTRRGEGGPRDPTAAAASLNPGLIRPLEPRRRLPRPSRSLRLRGGGRVRSRPAQSAASARACPERRPLCTIGRETICIGRRRRAILPAARGPAVPRRRGCVPAGRC